MPHVFFVGFMYLQSPSDVYHRNDGKNSQSKQISFSIYGQVDSGIRSRNMKYTSKVVQVLLNTPAPSLFVLC